jgi:hypothetical protein
MDPAGLGRAEQQYDDVYLATGEALEAYRKAVAGE